MDENNFQNNYNPSMNAYDPMNSNMAFNQQPQGFQQNPVVDQPINNGFQPQPQPQPKKKKGGAVALIIILVLVIALVGGAAAYYFLVVKSPRAAINTFLDNIDSKLGEASSTIESNSELVDFKASISVQQNESTDSANKTFISILNNSDLEFVSGIDKTDKRAIINLSLNYNNDPITLSVYFDTQTKGVYVYSKQILGKPIKVAEVTDETMESFINSLSNNSNTKNYVKAAQMVFKAVKNNIKDNMISASNATYMANGKEVSATKNTLRLTDKDLSELTYNVCKELVNNAEFINLFDTNIQPSIKSGLNATITTYETREEVKARTSWYDVKTTLEFSVYTDGFIPKAVRYEYATTSEITADPSDSSESSSSSSYYSYSSPKSVLDSMVKMNAAHYISDNTIASTNVIGFNIIDDENYEIVYDIEGDQNDQLLKLNIKKENENKVNIKATINIKGMGEITVNLSINREMNGNVPTMSVAGATELSKLSTVDMQKLITDLSAHEVTKPFASYVYLILLSTTYQQSGTYGNNSAYNSYYNSLLNGNNTTSTNTTNTTSTVPAGKQKVGDKDFGYVLIPSNWTRFVDPDAPSTLQYSYANLYILTMAHVPTSSMSAYQYASSYASRMKSEGVDVKTATVKMGDYTAYQVYGKYESENTWLVAWVFETKDGQTRSLAIEGPDASNEAFSIPDTFTLD